MEIEPRIPDALYKGIVGVFVALGCVCITAGATVALYAGWIVYLLIEDPKRVAIVAYLIDLTAKNLRAAHGSFDKQPFEIELGEPIYWLIFLLVGALLLSIVTGVAKALVAVGVELLKPAIVQLRRASNPVESGSRPPKV
jgi:Na+-driven multidrug efflux pump